MIKLIVNGEIYDSHCFVGENEEKNGIKVNIGWGNI